MELVGVVQARLAGTLEELTVSAALGGLTLAQARGLLSAPAPQPAALRTLTDLANQRQRLLELRVEATRQRRWSIPLLDALQAWGVVGADRWILACLLAHEVAPPLRRVGSLMAGGDALTVEVVAMVALGGGMAAVVELSRRLSPEPLHDLGLVTLGPWLRRRVALAPGCWRWRRDRPRSMRPARRAAVLGRRVCSRPRRAARAHPGTARRRGPRRRRRGHLGAGPGRAHQRGADPRGRRPAAAVRRGQRGRRAGAGGGAHRARRCCSAWCR